MPLAIEDKHLKVGRPRADEPLTALLNPKLEERAPAAAVTAEPKATTLASMGRAPEPRVPSKLMTAGDLPAAAAPLPPDAAEIDRAGDETKTAETGDERGPHGPPIEPSKRATALSLRLDRRLRPERAELSTVKRGGSRPTGGGAAAVSEPGANRSDQPAARGPAEIGDGLTTLGPRNPESDPRPGDLIPTVRAVPRPRTTGSGAGTLAALKERAPRQTPVEIPKIYQPRLEPDRSVQAQRTGASQERTGGRAGHRLADATPRQGWAMGCGDRSLSRWHAGQGRRRLHGALSAWRDLLRRVCLLGCGYGAHRAGAAHVPRGRLYTRRGAIRGQRGAEGLISC